MARRTGSRAVRAQNSRSPNPKMVETPREVYVVTCQDQKSRLDTARTTTTRQISRSVSTSEISVFGVFTHELAAKAAAEDYLDGLSHEHWTRTNWEFGEDRTWWTVMERSQAEGKMTVMKVEVSRLYDDPVIDPINLATEEGAEGRPILLSEGEGEVGDQDDDEDQDQDRDEDRDATENAIGDIMEDTDEDARGDGDQDVGEERDRFHTGSVGEANDRNGNLASNSSESDRGKTIKKRNHHSVKAGAGSSKTKGSQWMVDGIKGKRTPESHSAPPKESQDATNKEPDTPCSEDRDHRPKKKRKTAQQELDTPSPTNKGSEKSDTPVSGARKSERSRKPARRLED